MWVSECVCPCPCRLALTVVMRSLSRDDSDAQQNRMPRHINLVILVTKNGIFYSTILLAYVNQPDEIKNQFKLYIYTLIISNNENFGDEMSC